MSIVTTLEISEETGSLVIASKSTEELPLSAPLNETLKIKGIKVKDTFLENKYGNVRRR